ncbi:hypothetical protein [Acinetobacter entericus]|uniref:Uncharacterized protein n=1 Tax=Acinetobacter entericus TaxID=2989714 RepID=A0ABT3NG67_9GAMM|nr:hypothetical protein [Acinetobacter entericus]MCW8037950.1 hypothetical protein [Acinetobacter entericus]
MSNDSEEYTPPAGNLIQFNLTGDYVPPAGNKLAFDLGKDGSIDPPGDTSYIYPNGYDSSSYGLPVFRLSFKKLYPSGIASSLIFGKPDVFNSLQFLKPSGSSFAAWGKPVLTNVRRPLSPAGIAAGSFGAPKVFNSRQYIKCTGFDSYVYGKPYLIGGVKYLKPSSIAAPAISSTHDIRDPQYTQYIRPAGMSSKLAFGSAELFPKRLSAKGFSSAVFGSPWVQRSPMPKGFDTQIFGTAWVSHHTRTLLANSVEAPLFEAFPTVIFRNRKIYVNSENDPISVFGDVGIRNTRRYLTVEGFDAFGMSSWHLVETNRRLIFTKSIGQLSSFGRAVLDNRTLSIRPQGLDAQRFGDSARAEYLHRRLNLHSFDSAALGKPEVSNDAAVIKPSAFEGEFGQAFISNWTRRLNTVGQVLELFGMATVWHKVRKVEMDGFTRTAFGVPELTHYVRRLQLNAGVSPAPAGTPRISYLRQFIYPAWEEEELSTRHIVGREQCIQVHGFDAVRFGTRIIPESASIYVSGMSGAFGMPDFDFMKRYIKVRSFGNIGDADYQRWGQLNKLHNSRQYIQQYQIIESGLEPIAPSAGSKISNRNRAIQVYGFDAYKPMTTTEVYNNARLIQPAGMTGPIFGEGSFIAHRIRRVFPDPIEAPLAGKWHVMWNAARVLEPSSIPQPGLGDAKFENTRRYFRWIGGIETAEYGVPMVDFAVRTLSFNSRYTIAPPVLPLPDVQLLTRYIEPIGQEYFKYGFHELNIHWNKIGPKWVHRDYVGEPIVKNLTPELHFRAPEFLEMGKPKIELLLRYVNAVDGINSQSFGKPIIADRKQKIQVQGIGIPEFSKQHKLKKTVAPPYSTQHIWLDKVTSEETDEASRHYGFESLQFGMLKVAEHAVRPSGINALRFGELRIQSNGIRVSYGIFGDINDVGQPMVTNSIRTISLDGDGINSPITAGTPRFSPHTIYAVIEAPAQAIANHNAENLHRVGEMYSRDGQGSMRFGTPKVSTNVVRNQFSPYGFSLMRVGQPQIDLKLQYIECVGFLSYRGGFHKAGDGKQDIKFYTGFTNLELGKPTVTMPPELHKTIKPSGFSAMQFGIQSIENLHREVKPQAINSLAMGASRGGTVYMPQSLHIGFPMPTTPSGFDAARYGNAWISLRVREINPAGFNSFLMEYDLTQFSRRMKVTRTELPRPVQFITPVGFESSRISAFNIRPGAHYIRPDGNADQYRKGAF